MMKFELDNGGTCEMGFKGNEFQIMVKDTRGDEVKTLWFSPDEYLRFQVLIGYLNMVAVDLCSESTSQVMLGTLMKNKAEVISAGVAVAGLVEAFCAR